MPRPRTLSRKQPTTSPRMMDFVVGSGGSTSSSSSLPASALSVVASDMALSRHWTQAAMGGQARRCSIPCCGRFVASSAAMGLRPS
jgi:hypothetical protein